MTKIAVLGAGSWGSAIAIHLAANGHSIILWEHQQSRCESLQANRTHPVFLKEQKFPKTVHFSHRLDDCLRDIDAVFIAVPSSHITETLKQLKQKLTCEIPICFGTKGLIEGQFIHEVAQQILGALIPLAVLSGPSFAKEVAAGLPTAVTIASEDTSTANFFATLFHSKTFRPYISQDISGVEVGGVVKNILAIAVGISDGMGFGANARAALITRGLSEMKLLGQKFNVHENTLSGLAGMGDLILTATDDKSRNRRFGLALGEGLCVAKAKQRIGETVEGANAAEQVYHLAKKFVLELPICHKVYQIIYQGLDPKIALQQLLQRDIKAEI